jgi:hypothetical protein
MTQAADNKVIPSHNPRYTDFKNGLWISIGSKVNPDKKAAQELGRVFSVQLAIGTAEEGMCRDT